MFDHIRRAAEWAMRQFNPPSGCHRRQPQTRWLPNERLGRSGELALPAQRSPKHAELIRADVSDIVRPYVLTIEEQTRRRRESHRRTLLVCPFFYVAEAN